MIRYTVDFYLFYKPEMKKRHSLKKLLQVIIKSANFNIWKNLKTFSKNNHTYIKWDVLIWFDSNSHQVKISTLTKFNYSKLYIKNIFSLVFPWQEFFHGTTIKIKIHDKEVQSFYAPFSSVMKPPMGPACLFKSFLNFMTLRLSTRPELKTDIDKYYNQIIIKHSG